MNNCKWCNSGDLRVGIEGDKIYDDNDSFRLLDIRYMAFLRCNNCGARSPRVQVESKLIDPYALDMAVNEKAFQMRRYEEELKELDDDKDEDEEEE